MTEPQISFVVIGLNEAEHLGEALAAVFASGPARDQMEVLYVDSGSTDASCEIARAAGVDRVIEIPREGACAAAGRNAGLAEARGTSIQFVDGDSRLEAGWIPAALSALAADELCVGVEGHLRESRPSADWLHAVCEIDWPTAAGPVDFVGGNSLYRTAPLREAGGFDPRMRVGEEPELGVRLRSAGWHFAHLDVPMARHDLDLAGLGDYWHQAYKGGLSCGLVCRATGGIQRGYWRERLRKTLMWTALVFGPLLLGMALLPIAARVGLAMAALTPLILVALAVLKALRLREIASPALRLAYGLHTYASKLPTSVGIVSAWRVPLAREQP